MANKNTIRVAEFEKLYYDDAKPFKQKHWEALCRYKENQEKGEGKQIEYFKVLKNGIQFTNFVGVLQAGSLTIEILPKTDRERTTSQNASFDELEAYDAENRQGWHDVLLQMLKECRLLQVRQVNYANLNLKSHSILDIYIELFLTETERLLHEGLTKKYRKEGGNRLVMKGQLLFARNIAENIVHKERFFVRYTDYNRVNIYNQLLYKTLRLISCISSNPFLDDKVQRLLLDFPEMPDCKATTTVFDNLVFDRKTERYKEALLIGKMFLLNYRPDIKGGHENVIAILFDMNKLWEEFVFRRLLKAAGEGVIVTRQNRMKFWYNHTRNFYKGVKPDIIITKNSKKYVLDTKWKIIADNTPGDEDLKQMFVYNLLWNAERSVLLYPGNNIHSKGSFLHFPLSSQAIGNEAGQFYNQCSLEFIDVITSDGRLIGLKPFQEFLDML